MPGALGRLLQSFLIGELQRALPLRAGDYRLYRRRSPDQREVDVLADGGHHLVTVEINASASVSGDHFRHLKWFAAEGAGRTEAVTESMFYLGQEKLTFGDRTFALPLGELWSGVSLDNTGR